jgi:hypothetical protein
MGCGKKIRSTPLVNNRVIICDVITAMNLRNILRKFLGWQSLMRNYLVMHVSLN